tara:strand:- start:88 stop:249 length:162 start_codon:yes stop_codon:yes gene_type:complete
MSKEKQRTFLLKNIPDSEWKKFKQITIGRDLTLNENLLRLLTDYVQLNYSRKS